MHVLRTAANRGAPLNTRIVDAWGDAFRVIQNEEVTSIERACQVLGCLAAVRARMGLLQRRPLVALEAFLARSAAETRLDSPRAGLSDVDLFLLGVLEARGGLVIAAQPRVNVACYQGWLAPDAAYHL